METQPVAKRDRRQVPVVRREDGERPLGQGQRSQLIERALWREQVLVVHPHHLLPHAEVVVKIPTYRFIDRNEGRYERQRQIVAGRQLLLVPCLNVIEIEVPRGIAPEIEPRQDGQAASHALCVERLSAEHVTGFALRNQSIAEVRTQGQRVVAIMTTPTAFCCSSGRKFAMNRRTGSRTCE